MFDRSRQLVRASWTRRAMAAAIMLGVLASWAAPAHADRERRKAFVVLHDSEGEHVGNAFFQQVTRDKVRVWVQVWDLPPGFHGFHLHETGLCEPPAFTSAGGHYNPDETTHPDHAGDLPELLVMDDGTGQLSVVTDRVRLRRALRGDGTALMVHELPDNQANIPERYLGEDDDINEIDATTRATGDAGDRIACGVLQRHRPH